jgi:hypothetical protein
LILQDAGVITPLEKDDNFTVFIFLVKENLASASDFSPVKSVVSACYR